MSNNIAPVCPISRSQPVADQFPPALPVVPRALDLPSLIRAVNALGQLVMQQYGPGIPVNGFAAAPLPTKKPAMGGSLNFFENYYETNRDMTSGFIYHYADGKYDYNQKVAVDRIYTIWFNPAGADANPGMKWHWDEQAWNQGPIQGDVTTT